MKRATAKKRESAAAVDRLRDYQRTGYRNVSRRLKVHRRVLYVEHMGAGKTVVGAVLARDWAKSGRVLWLVHRGEILKQTRKKLMRAGLSADMIGTIWANHGGLNLDAPIQLATVQTLSRREAPKGITHIIVDEAHHAQAGSWRKILGWYPKAKVLGLTATPERLDGKPLAEFFDVMVDGEPVVNLIENGWLTKPDYWTREDGWRPDVKKLKRRGGDYAAEVAARAMSGSTIAGGIAKAYRKHGNGKPAVCFAATKNQAAGLVREFKRLKIAAETLFDEDNEREREEKLDRLRAGKTKVLVTCDVLGEGWDYDGCRCVIMARPTASLARWLQWAGRCMRPGADAVILDHAGNCYAHGLPWDDQEWSLEGRPKRGSVSVSVDADGRVTSSREPDEVTGLRLVKVEESPRQTVCAGWGEATCDALPTRFAFDQRNVRRRSGRPWRCNKCAQKMIKYPDGNVPIRQSTCAGWLGARCKNIPPRHAFFANNVKSRSGGPWRCASCTILKRNNPTGAEIQTTCAGTTREKCPYGESPPANAYWAQAVRSRNGRPWRCQKCAAKVKAESPQWRKNMFIAREKLWRSPTHRKKMREACRRRSASQEYRQKLVEAWKRRKARNNQSRTGNG